VRDVNCHPQVARLIEAQPHTLLRPRKMLGQKPSKLRAGAFSDLNHLSSFSSAKRHGKAMLSSLP